MLHETAHRQLPALLLIDDDEISREVVGTLLSLSGYAVNSAADGQAAVEMLATGSFAPGLILLDAQMPGLSGLPLIAALRAQTDARICLISASAPPENLRDAADGFLLKPFTPEDLDKLIAKTKSRQNTEETASETYPNSPSEASSQSSLLPILSSKNEERMGHGVSGTPGHKNSLAPDEPALNAETLAELRKVMPETAIREIFTVLIADMKQRLRSIEAALAAGDAQQVRRIGHSIKGACAMAGAAKAARLAALIESGALDGQATGSGEVTSKVDQLDNNIPILNDLHTAIGNLERILSSGFSA